jgi:arabinogalactan endo-1,4-beta-galactosidase
MKQIFLLIVFINASLVAQTSEFIKGVDISFIPQIEDLGGIYYVNGVETDPVEIFSQYEINYIRLRLWHSPANGYIGLESTLDMASRIKQEGLKFLLDFHYSDSWADPGQQTKPEAWATLTYQELVDSVYAYTFGVLTAFNAVNALPDMVQIGNEIISGFLWPEGRVGGSYDTPQQWQQFTNLLKTARNAVIDAVPDTTIPIMIHIDRGGDNNGSRWFFDNLNNYQVPFDIIGQSFYPWWHGTLTQLSQNLNDLATRYNKDIIVVETSYPWTLQPFDNVNNIVGNTSQLHNGYPATVQGQFNYLSDLIEIVKNVQNNKGVGVFYWAPEYISIQPIGSPAENLALFDFGGETLFSIAAFHEPDTASGVSVTFRLNTSTNWDTLRSSGFVQMRGEVVNGSNTLPNGEQIQWGQNSEIIFSNAGGDYWEKTVHILPGSEIHYKYWTGHSSNVPTFLRLGWEGSVQPYDSSAGDYRKFIAGESDTVLQVEYYNSSGTSINQYWKPFEHKEDSIAVYFRVNMGGVTSTGRFDPAVNGPVGIRGGPVDSSNILSWSETKVIFSREELSVNAGAFWSGAAYYPLSTVGENQLYKFFIENDNDNGWENNIDDRIFVIPSEDATINWVSFDDQPVIVSVNDKKEIISDFKLYPNYPNPFNPTTKVRYEIPERSFVILRIYDVLGNEIVTLINEEKPAGSYEIEFNASNLPSGVYFYQLRAGVFVKMKKMVLLE